MPTYRPQFFWEVSPINYSIGVAYLHAVMGWLPDNFSLLRGQRWQAMERAINYSNRTIQCLKSLREALLCPRSHIWRQSESIGNVRINRSLSLKITYGGVSQVWWQLFFLTTGQWLCIINLKRSYDPLYSNVMLSFTWWHFKDSNLCFLHYNWLRISCHMIDLNKSYRSSVKVGNNCGWYTCILQKKTNLWPYFVNKNWTITHSPQFYGL